MTEFEKQKLEKLLRVFKFAVKEEQKAQKMYKKFQNMFSYDNECMKMFDWLYSEEVEHEKKLMKKYLVFKRYLRIR